MLATKASNAQLLIGNNQNSHPKATKPKNLLGTMQSALSYLSKYNSSSIEPSFQISSLALSRKTEILYLASQDGIIAIINRNLDRKAERNSDNNPDQRFDKTFKRNSNQNIYQILEKRFVNIKIKSIILTQNEIYLLLLNENGEVYFYDLENKELLQDIKIEINNINSIVVDSIKESFYALNTEGSVFEVDIQNQYQIKFLYSHNCLGTAFCLSLDNSYLASGCIQGFVCVSNLSGNFIETSTIKNEDFSEITSLRFYDLKNQILIGDSRGNLYIYEFIKIEKLYMIKAHKGRINCIIYSYDTSKIFTGGEDCKVCIWDSNLKSDGLVLTNHKNEVREIELYNKTIITAVDIEDEAGLGLDNKTFDYKDLRKTSFSQMTNEEIYSISSDSLRIWICPPFDDCEVLKSFDLKSEIVSIVYDIKDFIYIVYKDKVDRYSICIEDSLNHFEAQENYIMAPIGNEICCFTINPNNNEICIIYQVIENRNYEASFYNSSGQDLEKYINLNSDGVFTALIPNNKNYLIVGEINRCSIYDIDNNQNLIHNFAPHF